MDFFSVTFGSGDLIKYQYLLEGADAAWNQPTEERTVNFANLAPGGYRLLVRAVNANGLTSPTPATVSFTIQRPLWQRWWFVMIGLLSMGLMVLAFYRSRLKRVIELERVRTRIATDLHDDIGSSLTQIAILSEVSRQQISDQENGLADALAQIANTSRDLVDSMSDSFGPSIPNRIGSAICLSACANSRARCSRRATSSFAFKGLLTAMASSWMPMSDASFI